MTRRRLLKRSLSAGGAIAVLPAAAWSNTLGANADIRVALAGIQRRGPQLIEAFRTLRGVRVVALCDADRQFVDREAAKFARRGQAVDGCLDFRRLLDRKDVDAVVIATPNHWHALMTVWACQAGKDVYVEKPVSHTMAQGRKMVEAARKHKRIVQAGTQNRSCTGLRQALAYVRQGHLGAVKLARGFDYPGRKSIGRTNGPQPVPKTVDYHLFQGPAPLRPLRRRNLHYDWHWMWETGDGDCGNRGVHTFDQIRWFLGDPPLPSRVVSVAGRLGWDDDGQTPNAQVTLLEGKPVPILWEMMTLPNRVRPGHLARLQGLGGSMVLEFEGGYLAGHRGGGRAVDRAGKVIRQFRGDSGRTHQANFIEAVRSRKTGGQRAEIRQGHLSTALCHLANISCHVGRRRGPKAIAQAVADNELLADSVARLTRHVGRNGVDLARTPLTLGASLAVDARAERFTGPGSEWANLYLTTAYRQPFVMPENV